MAFPWFDNVWRGYGEKESFLAKTEQRMGKKNKREAVDTVQLHIPQFVWDLRFYRPVRTQ